MSMQESPCSGYVAKAADLIPLIVNQRKRDRAARLLDEERVDELQELLVSCLPRDIPAPESCFVLSDEDTPDDNLEVGVVYAYYDECDLYIKTPTAAMTELTKRLGTGNEPKIAGWTKFG